MKNRKKLVIKDERTEKLDGNISGLMRKEQLSLRGVSLLKCRYSHFYLHLVLHLGSVFYHSSSTHL